jgi:hypothetical protein
MGVGVPLIGHGRKGKRMLVGAEGRGDDGCVLGFVREFTGSELRLAERAISVGGGSRGGGRERTGQADSAWVVAYAGRLRPSERRGREKESS